MKATHPPVEAVAGSPRKGARAGLVALVLVAMHGSAIAEEGKPMPAALKPDEAGRAGPSKGTSEAFVKEVEELLAGRPQNSIPKIAAVAVRWAAVDPAAALRYFENLPPHSPRRMGPSRSAIEAWLQREPDAARAFAKAAVERDEANSDYLDVIFKALLRPESADPFGEVIRYLAELPPLPAVLRQATHAIAPGMKNALPAAEAFAETFPPGESQDALFSMLGMAKAQVLGPAALENLAAKPALSASERLQLGGMATRLARQSPAELTAWLETQPADPLFDYARIRLAVDAYMNEPEKAQRIAKKFSRPEARARYAGDFLEYWLRKDFAAAETWAVASELPAELVAERIKRVRPVARVEDYPPKLDATLEIADERTRRQEQAVMRNWLVDDRPGAMRWIEANAKTAADREFFARMVRSTPEKPVLGPVIILE